MQTGSTSEMSDSSNEQKSPKTQAVIQTGSGVSGSIVSGSTVSSSSNTNNIEKTDKLSSARVEPIIITVENNLDKAMKILKRKLIKEGLFKELKTRRYFEKPSEKKKRKQKETVKKNRKEEARVKKSTLMS